MADPTPREVLFDELKEFGNISNHDLAFMLLSSTINIEGKTPRQRVESKSWLSRYVVHVQPGENAGGWLAPYDESVPAIVSRCKKAQGRDADQALVERFGGSAAASMRAALEAYGRDGAIFSNMVGRILAAHIARTSDSAELLVRLFVVAGASGNPSIAVGQTLSSARRYLGNTLATAMPTMHEIPDDALHEAMCLGLYRVKNGMMSGKVHRLSLDEDGTEIGALCAAAHAINDVDEGVSRRHLRIWRDEDGAWLAEGLGSRHGTVLVSGEDQSVVVVEPPRSERDGFESKPVNLLPADRLVLAGVTEFMVV